MPTPAPPPLRLTRPAVWATALVAGLLVAATVVAGGVADPSDAQVGGGAASSTIPPNPVPTVTPSLTARGRIAWVTPAGEVVVAESDGSQPLVVGSGAVVDSVGLAPLAWSGAGDLVAYVRNDGALVLAAADNSAQPIVAATDAVVTPHVEDGQILSFDSTGTGVAYLQRGVNGTSQAAVAVYDGPSRGTSTPLTDPQLRLPTAFHFSPMDPVLYLQSLDADTGDRLSLAVVDPFNHTPFGTPISVDDPVFAPDGAYIYGVLSAGLDQLARVDVQTAEIDFLQNQEQICNPQPSPDGTRIAYGSGRNCNELWVVNADGTDAERVARVVGRGNTFGTGAFSWSLDGTVVSHPSCSRDADGEVACGGAYIDVEMATGKVTRRVDAGSVAREFRPLIKPLKVRAEITGPLRYSGGMVVPTGSEGEAPRLTQLPRDAIVDVKALDERDQRRSFDLRLLTTQDSRFVVGTVHIVDPEEDFDQEVTVFGQILAQSARYAVFRGIWLRTSSLPFKSGRIDLTVYR